MMSRYLQKLVKKINRSWTRSLRDHPILSDPPDSSSVFRITTEAEPSPCRLRHMHSHGFDGRRRPGLPTYTWRKTL